MQNVPTFSVSTVWICFTLLYAIVNRIALAFALFLQKTNNFKMGSQKL